MKRIVIIGNGISGITAARHIRKHSDYDVTVVSSETRYFYSRTALMYVYMGHMTFENTKPYEDTFWKKNRINLVFDHAEKIHEAEQSVQLRSGLKIKYEKLIIATGSRSNALRVAGEGSDGVQALYSYQDLQRMHVNTLDTSRAVIVGGGLIGVEMAEMLRSRDINVTMLIREPAFWSNVLPRQDAEMISRHVASHGVELLHNQDLAEIICGVNGRVQAVRTKEGRQIPCGFVGMAVGVHPNTELARASSIKINNGILVNEFLETSSPDIYAIGDCAERAIALAGRKNIEQVWYTARMMGEAVAQTICGDRTPYEPGPWFNSAKFFDIEFQTYGNVDNVPAPGHSDFYWEHPSGRKALHIIWDASSNKFLGINSFGIRLRHERFDRWLRDKRTVQYVMDHLTEANFDPEFAESHEEEIRGRFFSSGVIRN